MQSISDIILADLSRVEKLKIWMIRAGVSYKALARQIGLTGSALGRICAQDTIPTRHHAALLRLGVPVEFLPQPKDLKSGPKPKSSGSLPMNESKKNFSRLSPR